MTPPNHDARIAKALEGIEKHNRELVKVIEALNNNFVLFGKIIKEAMEPIDEPEEVDRNQLKFPDGCVAGICPDSHAEVVCAGCGLAFCEIQDCGTTDEKALPCGCSRNYCCCGTADCESAKEVTPIAEDPERMKQGVEIAERYRNSEEGKIW